jgi:hypothetical protein
MKTRKLALVMLAIFLMLGVCDLQASLTDGLVAWYPFSGNANDASGKGNNATVMGATLTADRFGNQGSAYLFDGVNDFINIGSGVKPPFPISVSAWIRLDGLVPNQISWVFSNDYVNSGSDRYGIGTSVLWDGKLGSYVFSGFSAPWNRKNIYTNEAPATVGGWHHFAVVFTAYNDQHLFWDGKEYAGTYDGTGTSMLYSTSGAGALGMYIDNAGARYFKGAMDDIRVYSRVLSQDEIQQLNTVPVPAAVWLLGSGVIGLVALRRKLRS